MVQYPPQGTASTENFVTLDTSQTITGTKTFANTAFEILATGGQKYRIFGGVLGADRTINLPSNLGGNGGIIELNDFASTITATKTHSSSIILQDNVNLFLGTGSDFSIDFDATDGILNAVAGGIKIQSGATNRIQTNTTGIGFFAVTPVAQPAHIVDADGTLADITTKFNTLLAQVAALGLQAAV